MLYDRMTNDLENCLEILIEVLSRHFPEGKLRKTSVRMAGGPGEIRTEDFPNRSVQPRYHKADMPGSCSNVFGFAVYLKTFSTILIL
jgi:hypothetical protein